MTDPTSRVTVADRELRKRGARSLISRTGHADWTPELHRRGSGPDLEHPERSAGAVAGAYPSLSYGGFAFTFHRGAAAIMAEDLSAVPKAGCGVQPGATPTSNFGACASPSRELVFDANDFDETLPGPWEWDLKRLIASFVVAGEHLAFPESQNRAIAAHAAHAPEKPWLTMPGCRSWSSGTTALTSMT